MTDREFESWLAVPINVAASVHLGLHKEASIIGDIQRPFGGPNAMTATILGGLVGAGAGHVAGTVGEALMPEGTLERGRLRRSLAVAGGMLGAAPGLMWARTAWKQPEHPTLSGALTTHWPFEADIPPVQALGTEKASTDAGALFVPSIPVDAFNQAVWADVRHPANPYGTKSPWGDNDQSLYTPAPVAAAASGIVAGAGALGGSSHVSPWQVGLAAAGSAGKGYLAGLGVGKVFGMLAGLSPEAQSALRRTGLWGGLVTGAVRSLFDR